MVSGSSKIINKPDAKQLRSPLPGTSENCMLIPRDKDKPNAIRTLYAGRNVNQFLSMPTAHDKFQKITSYKCSAA